LAIQVCIGHTPGGRARHRTFSVKNIRPDADLSAVAALVRAIGPVLAYPITKARLIIKKVRVLFDVRKKIAQPDTAAPFVEQAKPAKQAAGGENRAATANSLKMLFQMTLKCLNRLFFSYSNFRPFVLIHCIK
jgi:hypothetical protein